jgi:ribonuclease BN (tRNA processing enzyme)
MVLRFRHINPTLFKLLIRFLSLLACALVIFSTGAIAQSAPKVRKPSPLELVVLGSGGPRSFGRASTSYVVLVDGTPRILMDAGSGAFLQVGKLDIDLTKLDIILLTHLHIDHSADLPAMLNARALTSREPIHFQVFGPESAGLFPSTAKFVHLLFDSGGAFEYQKTFGADETIDAKDLSTRLDSPEQEIVSANGLSVKAIATHHGDCPSVAYRIDYKRKSITFSGDMDVSALPNLERLAKGSDLLVFHAAVLDPPNSPRILYTLHTPPQKIGEAAQTAGVKHLLLSHIAPDIEESRAAVLRSIHASYHGPVAFAHDGTRVRGGGLPFVDF